VVRFDKSRLKQGPRAALARGFNNANPTDALFSAGQEWRGGTPAFLRAAALAGGTPCR